MLSFENIVRLASEAARDLDIPAEVVGAPRGGHDTNYAEVIIDVHDGEREPRRLLIGVNRSQSHQEGRHTIAEALLSDVHRDDPAQPRRAL